MSDDEFDLSDAEAYFPAQTPSLPSKHDLEELLADIDDEDDHAADQSCLALPEVLDRILLYVPPLDVHGVQRVSPMWRDLISTSIPIRRHMYFVPEKYFIRPELNRLLAPKKDIDRRLTKALDPFKFTLFANREGCGVTVELSQKWKRDLNKAVDLIMDDPFHAKSLELKAKPAEKQHSWRTILISDSDQPLSVELDGSVVKYPRFEFSSRLHGQVTLGDIVDKARSMTNMAIRSRVLHDTGVDGLFGFDDGQTTRRFKNVFVPEEDDPYFYYP